MNWPLLDLLASPQVKTHHCTVINPLMTLVNGVETLRSQESLLLGTMENKYPMRTLFCFPRPGANVNYDTSEYNSVKHGHGRVDDATATRVLCEDQCKGLTTGGTW